MRIILSLFLTLFFLQAKECADQYDSENFLDAPQRLEEVIDQGSKGLRFFGSEKEYKKLGFESIKTIDGVYFLKKGCYTKNKDDIYPVCSGIWRYHIDKNGFIDEFDIAEIFEYQDDIESVANEINSDFEGLWSDWRGDAYGHYLFPEDAQLRYGSYYLSFTVYLYGVKDDATELNNTVVNYRFFNYTKEVNNFIKCKDKNEKKSTFKR